MVPREQQGRLFQIRCSRWLARTHGVMAPCPNTGCGKSAGATPGTNLVLPSAVILRRDADEEMPNFACAVWQNRQAPSVRDFSTTPMPKFYSRRTDSASGLRGLHLHEGLTLVRSNERLGDIRRADMPCASYPLLTAAGPCQIQRAPTFYRAPLRPRSARRLRTRGARVTSARLVSDSMSPPSGSVASMLLASLRTSRQVTSST